MHQYSHHAAFLVLWKQWCRRNFKLIFYIGLGILAIWHLSFMWFKLYKKKKNYMSLTNSGLVSIYTCIKWRHRSGSTLAQVMTPSHYLNQMVYLQFDPMIVNWAISSQILQPSTTKISFKITFGGGVRVGVRNEFIFNLGVSMYLFFYIHTLGQNRRHSADIFKTFTWKTHLYFDSNITEIYSQGSSCLCAGTGSGNGLVTNRRWNGNIFRVTGLLCGKFTGRWWIPRTKASEAELWCALWCTPE